jgi:hypothetical protein
VTLGDATINKFAELQTWKRDGERAPHKPLLILLALGRLQRGDDRLMSFVSIEKDLSQLLVELVLLVGRYIRNIHSGVCKPIKCGRYIRRTVLSFDKVIQIRERVN